MSDTERVDRRGFLDILIAGLAVLGGLGGIAVVLAYLSPPQKRMLREGEPLEVAEETDIPVNSGRVVAYGSKKVLVVRTAEGFMALAASCTHAGCLVQWDPQSKRVHCPCHDGFFDLQGNVLAGPPPSPLKRYRAEVHDGKVIVGDA